MIVMLKKSADVDAAVGRARALKAAAKHVYKSALKGYALPLTEGQRRQLARDPAVEAIVPDSIVRLDAQSIPAGIWRVGATRSPATKIDGVDGSSQRINADAAIIDTGIQSNHPDLNVRGGINCTDDGRSSSAWGDVQGHGTHVAGIVGAKDNATGVVGVAPGVRLWSVRTFLNDGFSRISWIVCGIDWVTSQRDPADSSRPLIEVVNMSLRDEGGDDHSCGSIDHDPEHRAICASVARGTTYVVSSGNDHTTSSIWRPAAYDEVITVSAIADYDGKPGGLRSATCSSFGHTDRDDTFADFSNYGWDVDITAPGVCVRSTYSGSSYATISGTSMASPHVAGAAAVYKSLHPSASPTEVRNALVAMGSYAWSTATDPDPYTDPLLDISSLGRTPDFSLVTSRTSATLWAGVDNANSVAVDLRAVRGNGFAGTIDLAVDGLPAGLTAIWDTAELVGLTGRFARLRLFAASDTAAGTYNLTIRGTSDALQHGVPMRVVVGVDTTAPAVTPPRPSIPRQTLSATGPLVQMSWPTRETGTGLASMAVRERVGTGAWSSVSISPALATTVLRRQSFGSLYTYSAQATDRAGNDSGVVEGPMISPRGSQESAASYRNRWTYSAYSKAWGGRTRYATNAGAYTIFRFTGRGVALVAPVGPTRGSARIYVDDAYVRTLSFYSRTAASRRILFSRSWSTSGSHKLKVVVAGTAHRPRVDIDGFVVMR